MGGWGGGWLALILALTTAGLWTDAKKCLALALAEHMSGLGGQRGAALMLCYEMLKAMRAWPGPSESCSLPRLLSSWSGMSEHLLML